jgi:hypothetical protein
MAVPDLAKTLEKLGCPLEKSHAMAVQLDRRARMDAEQMGTPYEAVLTRVIRDCWVKVGRRLQSLKGSKR